MSSEQTWLWVTAGGAVVALVLLIVCALLWSTVRRLTLRLDELEADMSDERRTPGVDAEPVVTEPATYVITAMAESEPEPAAQPVVPSRIDGALFVDIVARETVVKAAGLAHGLRRGLSAESRNRIRFEFKREVKRSRKQRRADLKAALRHLQSQEDAA